MFKVKLNLRKVVAIVICLASVTMFSGCDKDEPNIENNGNGNDNGNTTIADPVGTITANISENTNVTIDYRRVGWTKPDNFELYFGNYYGAVVSICNLGKMNGLGNITSIPQTGYTTPIYLNREVACEVGHGYVVKFESQYSSPTLSYMRLYVVESIVSTSGGIMGAKVKYQYPFEP